MIADDTRGSRKRHYKKYKNEDQKEHQEIVTPAELLEELYRYINPDNLTDILDPCVGPGAMVKPFLEDSRVKKLTVYDIQEIHIKNFPINEKEENENIEKSSK